MVSLRSFGRRSVGTPRSRARWLVWIERKIGLTPNGVGLTAFAIVGFFLGMHERSRSMLVMAYGLVIVLGMAWLLGRRRLDVETRRAELPRRTRSGKALDAEVALTARRRVSTIVLQEELHASLGATVSVPVPLLPAGQEVTHGYSFSPSRRGRFTVGPLVATWSDPFGLTRRRKVLQEAVDLIVHPSTEQVRDRISKREWEDPPIRPPVSRPWPTGFEFYGTRDYTPGDDPRRIMWRATARTLDPETGAGHYFVRESEQGITDRVLILLDTDLEAHTPGMVSETFESAVRVAASLATRHLHDGFTVTIEANAERIDGPARGPRAHLLTLDALAQVELQDCRLTTCLERVVLSPVRNAHITVVTPYLDIDTAKRLRLLTETGASVLLALIVGDATDPGTLHRAGGIGANVVEVPPNAPLDRLFQHVVSMA